MKGREYLQHKSDLQDPLQVCTVMVWQIGPDILLLQGSISNESQTYLLLIFHKNFALDIIVLYACTFNM